MPTKSKAHTRENSAQADLLWRREAEALTEAAKWLRRAGKARAAAELHAKASQSEGHRLVLRAVHALDDGDMLRFVQLAQSSYDMLRHYASSRPAARIIAKARFIEVADIEDHFDMLFSSYFTGGHAADEPPGMIDGP